MMNRLCDAVGADADAFFRPNGDGSISRKYDPHSWIHDRESRPPNKLLGIPLFCIPLQTIYSCACFLVSALERGSTDTDEDDPDGNKRFLAFSRSFDVCVGYSAGQMASSAILKSDSVAKFQAMCLDCARRGLRLTLAILEAHNKQWGKEVMSKSWMCMFKVPVATLEKHIEAVNSEFPSTPLFVTIRLTPTQSVVSGHPTPLAKLQSLFPPHQVKVLPVTEGFHAPFYQTEALKNFLAGVPDTKYSLWNPVPNSAAFISTSLNADTSQWDTHPYCDQVHVDSMGHLINWPETVKAILSHNEGCDAVEIFDFGPPGVGFLTHALCASVFKKRSALINCVTAAHDDTPKVPPSSHSSTEPSRPKVDTETLTPMERKVLEIWCEVLPAQPSSIDEDFFEAGGDSIGMLKAMASADKRGLSLNLSDLFSARTIRSMAALLAESNSATKFKFPTIKPLPSSTPSNKKKVAPLSLTQHRLFFLDQLQPNSVQYSVFGGANLFGHLDGGAMLKAALSVVIRHESLRTRFVTEREEGSSPSPTSATSQGFQLILPVQDAQHAIQFREVQYPKPDKGCCDGIKEAKQKWLNGEFQKEVSTPFDLKSGPLMRLTLFRLDEEETVLFFIAHHIITDGWSMVVFTRELSLQYNRVVLSPSPPPQPPSSPITEKEFAAALKQIPPEPPALAFQYSDFAVWQRELLLNTSNNLKEKQLSFWKKELERVNQVCELPLDRPRTDNRTYSAGFHIHMIPPSLFSALTTLGKSTSTATPFITVLTVFNILLHLHSPRWSKTDKETTSGTPSNPQGDIVVGIPTANRHYPGVESLIGFFVNTLPIRTTIEESKSFKGTLESVKHRVLAAQEAQDVPLDWIVDTAGIEPRMSMHTLVQVSFVMDDWKFVDKKNFAMEGIRDVKLLYNIHPVMSKFDLTLNAVPQSDGSLELQFEFAKDILDDSTIIRFANNMETLMKSVVSYPDKPISQLTFIHEADSQSLKVWNSTEKVFNTTTTEEPRKAVHFLFEESVTKHGNLPALMLGEETVSYDELNNRANQLAHFLKSTFPDVGPGKLIPIIAERSIEQFVALYGVLKTGSGYVPIDPEAPPERIAAILEDISPVPVIILSHESLKSQLPLHNQQRVISISEDGDLWKSFPTTNPPHNIVSGTEEVYAIFTSGSTGKPKAAVNHHHGVANFVMWLSTEYKLTTEDRILHKTPFFFDGCALEVFASLVSGSCVVIAPPGAHRDPEQLLEIVVRDRVTTLLLVPTMLKEFISTISGSSSRIGTPKSLRSLIAAGEALEWDLVHKVFDCLGKGITFHNHYGPSEASCGTTFLDCSESLQEHPEMENNNPVVPLGKPISNVKVLIIDRNLEVVPVGVVGEICVGGVSVGKGYLNRPDLTSEKFVKVPAIEGLIYRTGDLGRFLPSGDVEFFGRIDFQVKLNGLRIELGEIERTILSHPSVESCAVILREDTPGVKFLAGYLVPKDKSSLYCASSSSSIVSEVPTLLKSRLPPYMVPSTFTLLPQLPFTSTGKLDRKALPIPGTEPPTTQGENNNGTEETLSPTEELLFQCLRDSLPSAFVSTLKLNSDFFSCGGNSLYVIRAVEAARKRGIKLSLRDFFEGRSIKGIASRIGNLIPAITAVEKQDRPQLIPLSFSQHRLYFLDKMFPGSTQYNMCGGVELEGTVDEIILRQAVRSVVLRHESLRTQFVDVASSTAVGDIIVQQIIIPAEDVDSSFKMQTVVFGGSDVPKEGWLESILAQESQKPFDLQNGPLLR